MANLKFCLNTKRKYGWQLVNRLAAFIVRLIIITGNIISAVEINNLKESIQFPFIESKVSVNTKIQTMIIRKPFRVYFAIFGKN